MRGIAYSTALGGLLFSIPIFQTLPLINLLSAGESRRTAGVPFSGTLKLDIYQPLSSSDQAPVVVFFHGGSWRTGQRSEYRFVGEALAGRGFVVIIPDYRKYPEARFPGFLEDGAAAIAWAQREIAAYGGDPQRIHLMGHSAGAYNAAMLAYDKRWLAMEHMDNRRLAGFIGLAGPYNFLPIIEEDVQPVFSWPQTLPDTQPIQHAGEGSGPPALLLTGDDDTVVNPVKNSGLFMEALHKNDIAVKAAVYPGLGHAALVGALARPLRWRAPVLNEIAGFVLAAQPRNP